MNGDQHSVHERTAQPEPRPARLPSVANATELNETVIAQVRDMFEYHPWDDEQTRRGLAVRQALSSAVTVIIENVPPGPDRSVAIRKLRDARMDCNSAITHGGKY